MRHRAFGVIVVLLTLLGAGLARASDRPPTPTDAAASPSRICPGGAGGMATLTASTVAGAEIHWYSNVGPWENLHTGNTFIVGPTETTTYYAWATWVGTVLYSDAGDAVTVTVGRPSSASNVSATKTSIYAGETLTLSATPPSGAVIHWYSNVGTWQNLHTGSSYTVSPSVTQTYSAWAVWPGTECYALAGTPITITVTQGRPPTPTNATVDKPRICSGESVTLTASTVAGAEIHWYSNVGTWQNLHTGNSYTTSVTQTTTFYAWATWVGTELYSDAGDPVTVTVGRPANATGISATKTSIEPGETITLSATPPAHAVIHWYSDVGTWQNLHTGNTYTVSPSVTQNYSAWAVWPGTVCYALTGIPIIITVTEPRPPVPSNAAVDKPRICSGESVTLTASTVAGAEIHWYSNVGPWENLHTGNSYTVTVTETTTFYAWATWEGTVLYSDAGDPVTVTVGRPANATNISATQTEIDPGETITLSATPPANAVIHWYAEPGPWENLHTGSSFTVSPTQSTLYSAWSVWPGTVCYANVGTPIQITVDDRPPTPHNVAVDNPQICAGGDGGAATLSASTVEGAEIHWYSNVGPWEVLGVGTSFVASPTVTTTYYAYATWEGTDLYSWEGAPITVTVGRPADPTGVSATATTIDPGESTTLSATPPSGAEIHWYSDIGPWQNLHTGSTYTVSPSTTTVYSAWATWPGTACYNENWTPIRITVNGTCPVGGPTTPTNPQATPSEVTAGGTVTLTASADPGDVIHWYTSVDGEQTHVATGSPAIVTPGNAPSMDYSAWAVVPGTSCYSSEGAPVTVAVTCPSPRPTDPWGLSADPTSVAFGGTVELTASVDQGDELQWWTHIDEVWTRVATADAEGTASVVPHRAGDIIYSAFATVPGTNCYSWNGTQVVVTVTNDVDCTMSGPDPPDSPSASPQELEIGDSIELSAVVDPGLDVSWYISGSDELVATGNPVTVTPQTAGTIEYYATAEDPSNLCVSLQSATVTVTVNGTDSEGLLWDPVDISFTATDPPSEPSECYKKYIKATFTYSLENDPYPPSPPAPITTSLFYNGGSQWILRFTGTKVGLWDYSIESNTIGIVGGGTVDVKANTGNLGFIKAVGNRWAWDGQPGKFFVPQLVMYDHPGAIVEANIPSDINTFFNGHGFNGFHLIVGCQWFDKGETGTLNDLTCNGNTEPDPETFQILEKVISQVHDAHGMVHIWLWGEWSDGKLQCPDSYDINCKDNKDAAICVLYRYIAARLGPLPGWTMGYGYDLQQWADDSDLINNWYKYWYGDDSETPPQEPTMGWHHLLSARDISRDEDDKEDCLGSLSHISCLVDIAAYAHCKPDYNKYTDGVKRLCEGKVKPAFFSDRYRIRNDKYREKDYNELETRQGLYDSTMAGGAANIWGQLLGQDSLHIGYVKSNSYDSDEKYSEWIRTYSRVFGGRLKNDLVRANTLLLGNDNDDIGDPAGYGVALRNAGNTFFIFYREDTTQINTNNLPIPAGTTLPAVAIDTTKAYSEKWLGEVGPGSVSFDLGAVDPNPTDWIVIVGGEVSPEASVDLGVTDVEQGVYRVDCPGCGTEPVLDMGGLECRKSNETYMYFAASPAYLNSLESTDELLVSFTYFSDSEGTLDVEYLGADGYVHMASIGLQGHGIWGRIGFIMPASHFGMTSPDKPGDIRISRPSGGSFYIDTVKISLPPDDELPIIHPDPIDITQISGISGTSDVDTFTISNLGGGTLSCNVTADVAWLNVYQIDGPTYGVAYQTEGLTVGTYYGTITITDANAENSPREISVTLSIVEGSGDPCTTDTDGDGTPDCSDGCPDDPDKIDPGTCGCGVPDTDSDGDGTADCNDGCPTDAGKITAGVCGCGVPDTDSDGDGTPDCNDGCPTDPSSTEFSPLIDGFETTGLWSFDHYSIFPGSSSYRSTWGSAEEHTGSYGLALSNQAYAIPTTDFIPAGAGNHTISAWVRGEMDDSSYGGWIIRVYFYDRNQQALSPSYLHAASCTGSASCVSTTWTKKSGTVAAPAGTAMIKIRLFFYMAGGWVAFDDLELDGAPLTVLNHGVDGGFETTTGWSLSSSGSFPASSQFRHTWGTADQHSGEYALALSNQAYAYPTTDFIAAGSGAHTISAWVRGEMNQSSLGGWIIRALYYDSNKQALSPAWENASNCTGSSSCLSTTWTEKSGTVTAPTGTAYIRIQTYFYMASGWIAYDDLSLDGTPLTVAAHGVDGGFETETGWTWSSLSSFPGSSIFRGTSGTADQRSGEYALALSNQAYEFPNTDFICAATGSYQVSVWLRGEMDDSSRGGWIVRARFYDINKSYISYQDSRACTQSSSCLSTTWSEKTGTVEAPAGTAYMKVQLYFFMADGWVDYDDLEVIKLD